MERLRYNAVLLARVRAETKVESDEPEDQVSAKIEEIFNNVMEELNIQAYDVTVTLALE